MTSRTSEVAVCCSSNSVRSRVRRLHLLEQLDIADGDHGLIGEGLQQGNLFIAERVNFRSAKRRSPRCSRPLAAGAHLECVRWP